jgi:hypothetical protein
MLFVDKILDSTFANFHGFCIVLIVLHNWQVHGGLSSWFLFVDHVFMI